MTWLTCTYVYGQYANQPTLIFYLFIAHLGLALDLTHTHKAQFLGTIINKCFWWNLAVLELYDSNANLADAVAVADDQECKCGLWWIDGRVNLYIFTIDLV